MKQLDTHTVIEIIKMIDTRTEFLINEYENNEAGTDEEYHSALYELNELQKHLQSYIESQLNAAENQTVE